MSVTGDFGRRPQSDTWALLDAGLVHFLASDSHDTRRRPPGLRRACDLIAEPLGRGDGAPPRRRQPAGGGRGPPAAGSRMNAKPLLALPAPPRRLAAPLAAVDPFYQSLLRDGQLAFDRKDYPTAARTLRLACFGMLDEPRPLADCLVAPRPGAGRRRRSWKASARPSRAWPRSRSASRATARRSCPPSCAPPSRRGWPPASPPPPWRRRRPSARPRRRRAAPAAPRRRRRARRPPTAAALRRTRRRRSPQPAGGRQSRRPAGAGPPRRPAARPPRPSRPRRPPAKPLTDAERKKLETGAPAPRRAAAVQGAAAGLRARPLGGRRPSGLEGGAAPGRARGPTGSPAGATPRPTSTAAAIPARTSPSGSSTWPSPSTSRATPPAAAAALKRALPNLKRTPYVESYIHKILGA